MLESQRGKKSVAGKGGLRPSSQLEKTHSQLEAHIYIYMYMYIYIYIYVHALLLVSQLRSADPGLGQGRGSAWDHRRCGTSCVLPLACHSPALSGFHEPFWAFSYSGHSILLLRGVQACRLPGFKTIKRSAAASKLASEGRSSLPYEPLSHSATQATAFCF